MNSIRGMIIGIIYAGRLKNSKNEIKFSNNFIEHSARIASNHGQICRFVPSFVHLATDTINQKSIL